MPNRIPTPGVSTPAVRTSKSAQPAMKPVENTGSNKNSAPAIRVTPSGGADRYLKDFKASAASRGDNAWTYKQYYDYRVQQAQAKVEAARPKGK